MRSSTVAFYLIDRLKELGVRHIFSVPGTYCADFLFALAEDKRESGTFIENIGVCSEKEAANAADGYFRCSKTSKLGVACVTYGVGPFNMLDGIAGAFTERVPVLLLNGGPSKHETFEMEQHGVLFAHATGRIKSDLRVVQELTIAQEILDSNENAGERIDALLKECLLHSRPVYLEVAHDVWKRACNPPKNKLIGYKSGNVELSGVTEAETLNSILDEVERRIRVAKLPVVLGGEEIHRLGMEAAFVEFITASQFSWSTTMQGKSIIPEDTAGFIGTYDSDFSPKEVRKVVDDTDCVIAIGTSFGDFYERFVNQKFQQTMVATMNGVRIGYDSYSKVSIREFLPALVERFKSEPFTAPPLPEAYSKGVKARFSEDGARGSEELNYDTFFDRMKNFIDEHMIAMCDTSLCLFPAADLVIQRPGGFVSQATWLSIGYTAGASLGGAAALPKGHRVIVFTGDGGFQMNPQALSPMIRLGHPTVIFIINNSLYSVEQFLVDKSFFVNKEHQPTDFCKIDNWNYASLVDVFKGDHKAYGRKVTTLFELDILIEEIKSTLDGPFLVDVVIPPKSLPYENRAAL
jgi:indolepyruvate decarboxylase